MIKAIIFDFGNVICTFDNYIFLKKISRHTNKTVDELNKLIYCGSGIPKRYETGMITSDEFYNAIVSLCSLDISKREFIDAYTQIFTPIPETYNLLDRLKGKYKVALLSNTSEWDFNFGFKPILNLNHFDAISLSFEVKAMKPDPKIYFDVLNKLKLKPEECVYIDDIKEYVYAANKLGINGIFYTDHTLIMEKLSVLGVKL